MTLLKRTAAREVFARHEDRPLPDRPSPPRSDHFDGRRFFNPGVGTDRGFRDILRWRRTSRPVPWPTDLPVQIFAPPPGRAALSEGEIAVTFIGQATFLITTRAATILTDPFFSDRASPLSFAGPRRARPPGLALEALPPIDLVLLSHNHYDHMDLPALRRLGPLRRGPLLTGLGNAHPLSRAGVAEAVELDWWQRIEPRPGVGVAFVPAQHWSSRTVLDRRRTLWGGFVVEVDGFRLYFAGDSGACDWFATIRQRCGAPDLALLPIGAYEPRWFMQPQHMNPAEAVRAHQDLGAAQSLGMHFGTIQLTDEAIDAPLHALVQAKAEAGLSEQAVTTIGFGETRRYRAALRL